MAGRRIQLFDLILDVDSIGGDYRCDPPQQFVCPSELQKRRVTIRLAVQKILKNDSKRVISVFNLEIGNLSKGKPGAMVWNWGNGLIDCLRYDDASTAGPPSDGIQNH